VFLVGIWPSKIKLDVLRFKKIIFLPYLIKQNPQVQFDIEKEAIETTQCAKDCDLLTFNFDESVFLGSRHNFVHKTAFGLKFGMQGLSKKYQI